MHSFTRAFSRLIFIMFAVFVTALGINTVYAGPEVLSEVVSEVSAKNLIYMTEEYPPFNFEKDGELKGIAVDVIERIFQIEKIGLTRKNIQVLPWARGYKYVLENENTVLFSTTRTKHRENLFKWVGPVAMSKVVLIAKKDKKIRIDSLSDLQKYSIGVIRDDIGEQLIRKAGIGKENIDAVSKGLINVRKLVRDRIDLWAYSESVAMWFIKKNGFDPNDFETVYVLMEVGDLYYAFNKNTPDPLIAQFQNALDRLKIKDGDKKSEYEIIRDKYLK